VRVSSAGGEPGAEASAGGPVGTVEIELLDPAQGVAPGQAAVIYDGSRVVGSATITEAVRRAPVGTRG